MKNNSPTFGEKVIRVDFNASGSDKVHKIKTKFAELINEMQAYKNDFVSTYYDSVEPENASEVLRLHSLTLAHIETSAMFAVKFITSEGFPS